MKVTAEWWVQKCLDAAEAAAERATTNPDAETGMPVYDKEGDVDIAQVEKWLKWAMGGGRGRQTVQEAASAAFLCEMPPLVSRGHTKAFIACVAAGVGHKYLTPLEAKSLMYSAQLALSAFRPRARERQTPTHTAPGDAENHALAETLRAQNRRNR